MYQAIHYNENGAMADRLSYLQRHDIVYCRPALRPYDGLAQEIPADCCTSPHTGWK